MKLQCALVGSRYFGASVFDALRHEEGIEFTAVVAPAADDRLALAARKAGIEPHLLADPRIVPGEAIAEGTDLIVAAHTHARVSDAALARSRLGGVGYHPSLLPRHRGIAAVEWTILAGDPIAGGSVYHLSDGWDAGAIAAQDWCFVGHGETARELWERALAPLGLRLLKQVVGAARLRGALPAQTQDERYATKAPKLRGPVVLEPEAVPATAALVVTVVGPDRPGIVSLLSDRAQRFGANWTTSRMSRLAGEFAGVVHFDVPAGQADALAAALRALESAGLRIVVARSDAAAPAAAPRAVELELVADDRVGIVSRLTRLLADRGVGIESLDTEVAGRGAAVGGSFKVKARLVVPASLPVDELRRELGRLAHEITADVALDQRSSGGG